MILLIKFCNFGKTFKKLQRVFMRLKKHHWKVLWLSKSCRDAFLGDFLNICYSSSYNTHSIVIFVDIQSHKFSHLTWTNSSSMLFTSSCVLRFIWFLDKLQRIILNPITRTKLDLLKWLRSSLNSVIRWNIIWAFHMTRKWWNVCAWCTTHLLRVLILKSWLRIFWARMNVTIWYWDLSPCQPTSHITFRARKLHIRRFDKN